jgi:hypothetical protein
MKFIEILKKYKVYILSALLIIFFFRSCSKSVKAGKMEDKVIKNELVIDSLQMVVNTKDVVINGFPEVLRKEKIKVHSVYDNYISEKDRGEQLMELHMIVKENLKELQDVK